MLTFASVSGEDPFLPNLFRSFSRVIYVLDIVLTIQFLFDTDVRCNTYLLIISISLIILSGLFMFLEIIKKQWLD